MVERDFNYSTKSCTRRTDNPQQQWPEWFGREVCPPKPKLSGTKSVGTVGLGGKLTEMVQVVILMRTPSMRILTSCYDKRGIIEDLTGKVEYRIVPFDNTPSLNRDAVVLYLKQAPSVPVCFDGFPKIV